MLLVFFIKAAVKVNKRIYSITSIIRPSIIRRASSPYYLFVLPSYTYKVHKIVVIYNLQEELFKAFIKFNNKLAMV